MVGLTTDLFTGGFFCFFQRNKKKDNRVFQKQQGRVGGLLLFFFSLVIRVVICLVPCLVETNQVSTVHAEPLF